MNCSRRSLEKTSRDRRPASMRPGVAKESHHNQVTIEEFDRAQLGIAAKE